MSNSLHAYDALFPLHLRACKVSTSPHGIHLDIEAMSEDYDVLDAMRNMTSGGGERAHNEPYFALVLVKPDQLRNRGAENQHRPLIELT